MVELALKLAWMLWMMLLAQRPWLAKVMLKELVRLGEGVFDLLMHW